MPRNAAFPRPFSAFRILFVCCTLISLLGIGVSATAQQTYTQPVVTDGIFQFVPGELLVKLSQFTTFDAVSRSTTSDTLNTLMQSAGVASVEPLFDFGVDALRPLGAGLAQYVKMTLSPDADVLTVAGSFQVDPSVELASPNFIGNLTLDLPNDEYFVWWQWALNNDATAKLNVPAAWEITTGSDHIVVAVLDSGFDYNHEDLDAKNTGTGRNFVNGDFDVMDGNGHGTAVAGIIGAETDNNGTGVAGISWGARIMPVKVGDAAGQYALDDVLHGIVWAANGGANIINMSFGGPANESGALMMQDAVIYARNAGVILVAAAGNDGEYLVPSDSVFYIPAELDHVIVVGATSRFDDRCDSAAGTCNWTSPKASGWGPQLDVMAPGSADIWTTDITGNDGYNGGDYTSSFGGTSAAAPHVSGTIALMLSVNQDLSPDQVEAILKDTAVDLGATGRDDLFGHGRIDVHAAVLAASTAGGAVQATTRVSVSSDGGQANNVSSYPSISGEGRFVAFSSMAMNLVPNDTNHTADIFVYDRLTREIARVSVSSYGDQAHNGGINPAISEDGRYVAFESSAFNLVLNDTNNTSDVFVHDRLTGETSRVSVGSDGVQGNGYSRLPAVSGNGRYVAFESYATNLITNDTNGSHDVFVHDRLTGETSLVSASSGGTQGNDDSKDPTISGDGRFVAFYSDATNLVINDTNRYVDIFVHDRLTRETTRVSVSSDGDQGNQPAYDPAISGDGRYVAFNSNASNLVQNDTNHASDVFVHDRETAETSRASVSSDGTQGNRFSRYPTISGDGRYVAFESSATNLITNDTNGSYDVFVHDRLTGETSPASVSSGDTQGNGISGDPIISGDGRYVAFVSAASNLVPNDTNGAYDVFVHDRMPSPDPVLPNCDAPSGLDICDLEPGDILLTTTALNSVLNLNLGGAVGSYWIHAGMYDEDENGQGYILEARGRGTGILPSEEIQRTPIFLTSFYEPFHQSVVLRLKPDTPNRAGVIVGALSWANDKVSGENARYTANFTLVPPNFIGFLDPTNKSKLDEFYSSMFVWRAYYEQGIDLDYPSGIVQHSLGSALSSDLLASLDAQVLPDDLYASAIGIPGFHPPATDIVQGASIARTLLVLLSPADLLVTDSEGNSTGYDPLVGLVNDIPDTFYSGPDTEPEWISVPGNVGLNEILVRGDGTGSYILASDQFVGADEHVDAVQWYTQPGQVDTYSLAAPESAGDLTPVYLTPTTNLSGSVTLQGRPTPPDPEWATQLHVIISEAVGASVVYDEMVMTDDEGAFNIVGVPAGDYRIWVKGKHSLGIDAPVTLAAGNNLVNLGVLREGDANDDNSVNISDFSILAAAFSTTQGQAAFDARADFNEDGAVNISDFSLLASNFSQTGAAP